MSAELNPKGVVHYHCAEQLEVRCGVCAYYDAEQRRCVLVAGEIEADGVCVLFVARRPMRGVGTGVPTSVSTIPVLDIPTLGRMDLMPGYADVRRSFVSQGAAGELVVNAAADTDQAWMDLIVAEARRLTGITKGTQRVGKPTDAPLLDLVVCDNGEARLVPHSPYLAQFEVVKQDESRHFTLGPLYMPDTLDAHGEFVESDTLQNAAWDYVRSAVAAGSNTIYDQHTSQPAGEWVEIVTWPYEHVAEVVVPGQGVVQRTFPAGTVYQGVVWSERVWPEIISGAKRGLSMGGTAVREPVAIG